MTNDELLKYLNTCYREVVDKLSTQEKDGYQYAALVLLNNPERWTDVHTEDDFVRLLHAIGRRRNRQLFSNQARREQYGTRVTSPWEDDVEIEDMDQELEASWDEIPDKSTELRDQALEYIQLLPKAYRRLFVKVYIEGKTDQEVADETGVSKQRVSQMIHEGIQWIRDEIDFINGQ